MKRLNNILRSFFVSFEFISGVSIFLFFYFFPDYFTYFGKLLKENDNKFILFILPFYGVFLTLSYSYATKIRIPKENNKELYKWEDYKLLKDTVIVGLIFSSLSAVIAVITYFFSKDISSNYLSLIFISTFLIAAISTLSLYSARIYIIEIIDKET